MFLGLSASNPFVRSFKRIFLDKQKGKAWAIPCLPSISIRLVHAGISALRLVGAMAANALGVTGLQGFGVCFAGENLPGDAGDLVLQFLEKFFPLVKCFEVGEGGFVEVAVGLLFNGDELARKVLLHGGEDLAVCQKEAASFHGFIESVEDFFLR